MKASILYIEDDTVDIISFNRQLKNEPFWEVTLVKKINDIDFSKKYTLVITDANFENGNYKEVIKKLYPQEIVVVSGSEIDNMNNVIYFQQKPINFTDIITSIYTLNFSKISEMAEGDADFIKEIVKLTSEELEINTNQLLEAFNSKNSSNIKFYIHKLKSKINLLQIPCVDECNYLEKNPDNFNDEIFQKAQYKILLYCNIALSQIHTISK